VEVQVLPETATKLNDLAPASGRALNEIVEDALYLEEGLRSARGSQPVRQPSTAVASN
jgi:hypothetical protein